LKNTVFDNKLLHGDNESNSKSNDKDRSKSDKGESNKEDYNISLIDSDYYCNVL
jgi:hypothetical protein